MHTATRDTGAARQAMRWSALDERAEWEGFSRPLPGRADLWESYLAIEGMHCAACSLTVEEVLQKLPGVDNVQVNGASAVARVAWSPGQGRPSAWLAALQRAGYGALPAGDMLAAAPRIQAQRMMLWRWLVAGFCMMQVMMYAFPAYIAEPGDISPEAQGLLRWASWVLTLPVVLFSCWPFFSSALRDLRNRRIGMDVPVALGILIAFGASSAATFDPASRWGAEVWYDSVTMFVFFLLSGRLLEQRLRDRTAGSLEALMRSLPDGVERQGADGTFERVAVRRLVPGDLIRLLPGDVIPADGTVTAGESQVDEALLTGESTPLQRRVGSAVIAGSHNLSGMLLVRVERAGSETRYAGMVALMEQASVQKPRLARIADRIAGPFVLLVLLASAAAALWWWPTDPVHAISVAVAVLIVTCPCALSLATPAATLAAAGALARRGVLVRRLEALESCAMVDTVVFDKTGTLTEDRIAVTVGRTREGTTAAQALLLAAALAQHSLHPLSRAMVQAAGTVTGSAVDVTEVSGQGLQGHVAADTGGKPRVMRLGSAAFCGASPDVQAAGGPQVHLSDEQGWLASFEMDEALRPDARPAVGALHALGLQVQLLSGDLLAAVTRLAARAGIDKAYGQRTPEGKLAHVRELQQQGRRVAMVGDGMNDGPVLACADVSVAMGQAVPLAQAKSDFIVLGGQLAAVSALLQHARRTRTIVRQNLLWAALYNAVCVPLAILGFMPPWLAGLGMAASSLLVVLNSARLARLPG
ncbi:cation-translocating P-type ATPase [Polaromonas sp. AER18D-145]|uniref:heavy metal translocating P-type ATPase n=1 Tax=Polaromonas sp. AER18D-145 TaxID=1977060 RepID=UPI00148272A2|nr:cation-translocating P-type ATPase [Polaromonas sp. AER18D-145]